MAILSSNINFETVIWNLSILEGLRSSDKTDYKLLYCMQNGRIYLEYVSNGYGIWRATASLYNKLAWYVSADSGYERDISNLTEIIVNIKKFCSEQYYSLDGWRIIQIAEKCIGAVIGLQQYSLKYCGQNHKVQIIQGAIELLKETYQNVTGIALVLNK